MAICLPRVERQSIHRSKFSALSAILGISVVPIGENSAALLDSRSPVTDEVTSLATDSGGGGGTKGFVDSSLSFLRRLSKLMKLVCIYSVGRWRCKEMFPVGRRTCQLLHTRLGLVNEMD